jgi:hypothetical protein
MEEKPTYTGFTAVCRNPSLFWGCWNALLPPAPWIWREYICSSKDLAGVRGQRKSPGQIRPLQNQCPFDPLMLPEKRGGRHKIHLLSSKDLD